MRSQIVPLDRIALERADQGGLDVLVAGAWPELQVLLDGAPRQPGYLRRAHCVARHLKQPARPEHGLQNVVADRRAVTDDALEDDAGPAINRPEIAQHLEVRLRADAGDKVPVPLHVGGLLRAGIDADDERRHAASPFSAKSISLFA